MSDKLHLLIHTLTKAEKRYFKLFSKKTAASNEKNYVKLFDCLEAMEDYQEAALVEHLKEQNISTTYLAADKNYLYNLILESLSQLHSSKTNRFRLRRMIDKIEILADKGLKNQALKQLKKAKKLAEQHEIFLYLPDLLALEKKIKDYPVKMSDLDKDYENFQEAIAKLSDNQEFDFLYRRSFLIRRQVGKAGNTEDLKAFQPVIEHSLMQSDKELPSFFAKIRYYQTWATYYYSKDDWLQEYECNKKLIELMTANAEFLKEQPYNYAATFSRLLILTKRTAPQDYFSRLQQFKAIPTQVKRDKRKVYTLVYSIVYSTESVRMIVEGKYDEGLAMLPQFEAFLMEYSDLIDEAFKVNSYYKFAYISIAMDDYSKALDYINRILNDFDEKLRPDIYCYAKVLSLIIHLELGHYNLLPYLAKSTAHHLKSRHRLLATEKALLAFFKKIKPEMPQSLFIKKLEKLKKEWLVIFEDAKERKAAGYFDFLTWIKTKLEGKSFLEGKKI